ncbi:hypothetical protein BS47DRAFT_1389371 [Hydnum rufescens UP504]|uniref:Uncharacterized protein n=1 Tax=Hydnum rufescens UP504 TaxID=1448309 RepID=A0A9P6DWX6_9AGAM|nr:hypothetical protein BS47DRAFT_1389371 [Hydnum rufescens UP504]
MSTGYERQSWLHMLDEDSFGNVFGFSNRPSSSGFAKANHSDRGDSGKIDAEDPQEIYAPLSPPTTTGAASSQSYPGLKIVANMSLVGGTQPLDDRLPSGPRSITSFTSSHHPVGLKEGVTGNTSVSSHGQRSKKLAIASPCTFPSPASRSYRCPTPPPLTEFFVVQDFIIHTELISLILPLQSSNNMMRHPGIIIARRLPIQTGLRKLQCRQLSPGPRPIAIIATIAHGR